MNIKPIQNEEEYAAALMEIDGLFDAEPGTPEGARLEALADVVDVYNAVHYRLPAPDPVDAIEYHMERLHLTCDELEARLGRSGWLRSVLNRQGCIPADLFENIHNVLDIPIEILSQEYSLGDGTQDVTRRSDIEGLSSSGEFIRVNVQHITDIRLRRNIKPYGSTSTIWNVDNSWACTTGAYAVLERAV